MKQTCLFIVFILAGFTNLAQPTPFVLKGALKENRQQLYRNIVKNSITKNLSQSLSDSTESLWQEAFEAMELINYKSAWTDAKIHTAFDNIETRSPDFQRALLELTYANYPDIFFKEVKSLLLKTKDAKIFAMCAVYILKNNIGNAEKNFLSEKIKQQLSITANNPILQQLQVQVKNTGKPFIPPAIRSLFKKDFLPGNVLMLSIQRADRNYPGLVIVRDSSGNFMKENGKFFAVPQLARSIANLPGYLTNGNTPEGIYRMDGFDTSLSTFIGPTTNVQLTMPFEYRASHFYKDSSLTDSTWNIDSYKKLLPTDLQAYDPLYQSYYAGKAGRTEIIAHGTTMDPLYYKDKVFYPLTPTLGCLCTKEIWNEETGRLMDSDQQKLADAINKAGGPNGYAIVINIDDGKKAVTLDEIIDFLQHANQN